MIANDSLIELLGEVCTPLGAFKVRRMFGGHGLYLDGVFFAILAGGVVYFKTSDGTRGRFAAEGMSAYTYKSKSGTHALVSYWRVPERLLDEREELAEWIRQAVGAARGALRSRTKSAGRTKPRVHGARS